jgi:hypothetical protein
MKKLLGIIVLGLLLSGNAKAETNEIIFTLTHKMYRELLNNDPQKADQYVYALWSGIMMANVASKVQNKTKLYCMPKKLALNPDNIHDIIMKQIQVSVKYENYDENDSDVVISLMRGLMKTFPCK